MSGLRNVVFSLHLPDHVSLSSCRTLQEKRVEALPLLERALAIRQAAFGDTHKDTVESQARLDQARQLQVSEYASSLTRWLARVVEALF